MKQWLNGSTIGSFGGRGMGQTCGVADPSQWMKMFGVDIDTRDTTELMRTAQDVSADELARLEPRIRQLFGCLPEKSLVNERSLRLYLAIKKLVAKNRLGLLHHPIVSRPGRRLRRHVLCPKHDAGRRLRHLDPGRSEHGA